MTWEPTEVAPAPTLPGRELRLLGLVAAIAGGILVAGMVMRATAGIHRPVDERVILVDPETREVRDGRVELVTASSGPLFPGATLAPGTFVEACISIEHRGDVPLEDVAFRITEPIGSIGLLEALRLNVDRGQIGPGATRGSSDDCAGFVASERVLDGVLGRAGTPTSGQAPPSWAPLDGERVTYRIRVELSGDADDQLQGEAASVDFRWVALAEPVGDGWTTRAGMVVFAVARDAVLPLLFFTAMAVLFLGVQDRIDRRDPKLAVAAVREEPLVFSSPTTVADGGGS